MLIVELRQGREPFNCREDHLVKVLLISKAPRYLSLKPLAGYGQLQLSLICPAEFRGERLNFSSCNGVSLFTEKLLFSNSFHFSFYPRLGSLVRELKPDLVHLDDEPYNVVAFHCAAILNKLRIKYLFVSWQNIFKTYPPPFESMEQYVIKNAQGAITRNTEARDRLIKKGARLKIEVIPCGVDLSLYRKKDAVGLKRSLGLEQCFVVGFCGRLVREKGIDILLEAFAGIGNGCKLLIIGDGPYRQSITRRIDILKIRDRCVFAGKVSAEDMPEYLNCLDCLVLPSVTTSSIKEQFGRVLTEAMACGVAVIGSSSGEIPNVIGGAGIVFPEKDAGQLRAALVSLKENQALRNEYAHKGLRRAAECFSDEVMAEKTYRFYKEIMEER